ncbi:MAG: pseudoazurin [Pseudomonadota bacterium]
MKLTRRETMRVAGAAALTVAGTRAFSEGTVHEVQMLNKGGPEGKDNMVFEPPVIRIEPGDTVNFVSVDRGHNSAATDGMLPEGAEPWKGKIGKDIEVTFDVEGAYGYNCTPHKTVGMVGLILVGNVDNLEALKEVRQRGKAKQRYEEYFAMAEEMLAGS